MILNNNGVVNSLIWDLGLRPHGDGMPWLIYSKFSVGLVLFYCWVPFVALPMFAVLENMDRRLLEAAQDLGACRLDGIPARHPPAQPPGRDRRLRVRADPDHRGVHHAAAGGRPQQLMFGNSIQSFFTDTPNWNYGAVLALWLVAVVLVMLLVFGRFLGTDLEDAAT